jgi:hypothetical protein
MLHDYIAAGSLLVGVFLVGLAFLVDYALYRQKVKREVKRRHKDTWRPM